MKYDAYILVKGNIIAVGQGPGITAVATNRNNKQIIFEN